jgi:hypothetical protein
VLANLLSDHIVIDRLNALSLNGCAVDDTVCQVTATTKRIFPLMFSRRQIVALTNFARSILDRMTGWTRFDLNPVDPVNPVDQCAATDALEYVARSSFGRLQSVGTRVGLAGSVPAAMRHVTMKCTGDRERPLGDGQSLARSP